MPTVRRRVVHRIYLVVIATTGLEHSQLVLSRCEGAKSIVLRLRKSYPAVARRVDRSAHLICCDHGERAVARAWSHQEITGHLFICLECWFTL